jgi:opacity protein-like surface antigen
MTNQSIKKLQSNDPNQVLFTPQGMAFDSSMLFGLGVGYQYNSWLRFDVTGQYRGRATFHGSEYTNAFANSSLVNNYSGSKSEALFLANAYVDLGTWWCVTPFIGAGVGTSYNRISSFRDDGFSNTFGVPGPVGITYAQDAGKWDFAWAAHAGLAYKINPALTIELGYSYVNLGSGKTGTTSYFDGTPSTLQWTFKDITSHDVKLGVRWNLDSPPVYAPPLIRKG